MNKQIEEMANIVHDADAEVIFGMLKAQPDDFVGRALPRQVYIAKALYNAGYRKASVGNWVDVYNGKYANQLYKCSVCGMPAYGDGKIWFLTKFCPSCGADMRGEVQ